MNLTISNLIAIGGLLLATITFTGTLLAWYTNAEKRRYGLERDFNHLKRNYEQIQQSLNLILSQIDNRFDITERDILEIKSTLNLPLKRNNAPSKD